MRSTQITQVINSFFSAMTTKDWLKIGAFLLVFCAAAPYLLKLRFWLFSTPQVVVDWTMPLSGYITGSYVNRQHHSFYLDGNTKTYYDFNAFVPAAAYPQPDTLSQDDVNNLVLGAYLTDGDHVSKPARSNKLLVRRGNGSTQWLCPPRPIAE